MLKKIREYNERYGDIPKDFNLRYKLLLNKLKVNNDIFIQSLDNIINTFKKRIIWNNINFIFYVIPDACPRPRYNRLKHTFYVKGVNVDFKYFKECYNEEGNDVPLITTPCKFYCDVYSPIPSTMNKLEKVLAELGLLYNVSTPDWDNVAKKYSDFIQKEIILNDSLIVKGIVNKYYSTKPRIEIRIEYLNEYDCNYNKKKIEGWKSYKDKQDNINEKDHMLL